jgi:hypothetical protein
MIHLGLRDGRRERRHDVGWLALEVDAVAVPDVDETHDAQRRQRLAHRRAADAELLGELPLGQEPVARLEVLPGDELLQAMRDLLVERASRDRP